MQVISRASRLKQGAIGTTGRRVHIAEGTIGGYLIKEKVDGKWSLPGGWADVNTSLSESVTRECIEEAGAKVDPKRIIAIHLANRQNNNRLPYTIYKVFVECDLLSVEFKENTETLDSGFFAPAKLPELSTNRTSQAQIEMCFEARRHKLFEPLFD